MTLRGYCFEVLHQPQLDNRVARRVNAVLTFFILANCLAVALETVPAIYRAHASAFFWFEAISVAVFLLEYVARLWSCVELSRFSSPIVGRLKYALRPLAILDLVVIATYFAPFDLRFLRIFRLAKLLRVLNLDAFDHSLRAVSRALGRRKNLLVVSVTVMLTMAYCFAALLYAVEHQAQPERFSSIPETLWWAVVTLTTIGYGDVYPITIVGKLVAGAIVMVGIGIFALPSAIVTAAVLEAGTDQRTLCPHCGKRVDGNDPQ